MHGCLYPSAVAAKAPEEDFRILFDDEEMNSSHYIIVTLFLLSQWSSSTLARPVSHRKSETGHQPAVPSEEAPRASTEVTFGSLGLIWDECDDDGDCLAPRTCMLYSGGESRSCDDERGCVCDVSHNEFCLLDTECHPGEYCLIPFEGSIGACFSKTAGKRSEGASPDAGPSTTPELPDRGGPGSGVSPQGSGGGKSESDGGNGAGGGFCIGMNILRNMSRGDLLYERDVEARVLCDKFDSCATAGHVVVFRGSVMMMKTYCARVGCVDRVMFVNNPRSRGAKVASFSKGLVFTAYSARYGTRVEETMFRMLTAFGF